jgi:hypothetical protein
VCVLRNRDLEERIRADLKVTRTDRVGREPWLFPPGGLSCASPNWTEGTQPSHQCDLQLRHQGTPNREAQPPFTPGGARYVMSLNSRFGRAKTCPRCGRDTWGTTGTRATVPAVAMPASSSTARCSRKKGSARVIHKTSCPLRLPEIAQVCRAWWTEMCGMPHLSCQIRADPLSPCPAVFTTGNLSPYHRGPLA